MKSFKEMFDSLDNNCIPHQVIGFDWSAKGIGFGQMHFYFDDLGGYVHCDNES